MKISSQLANNFDYCSAEFYIFKLPLRALSVSAVSYTETSRPKNKRAEGRSPALVGTQAGK
jgi:hypothetical protein